MTRPIIAVRNGAREGLLSIEFVARANALRAELDLIIRTAAGQSRATITFSPDEARLFVAQMGRSIVHAEAIRASRADQLAERSSLTLIDVAKEVGR